MYDLEYDHDWQDYFEKVPLEIQKRFMKKIDKFIVHPSSSFEHKKHGVPFFSDRIGPNYRICFSSDENTKKRKFYFIGDHKEYEKWLRNYSTR